MLHVAITPNKSFSLCSASQKQGAVCFMKENTDVLLNTFNFTDLWDIEGGEQNRTDIITVNNN